MQLTFVGVTFSYSNSKELVPGAMNGKYLAYRQFPATHIINYSCGERATLKNKVIVFSSWVSPLLGVDFRGVKKDLI